MNRRFFLKSGSIALASVGMSLSAPSFLERIVLGNALTGGKRKTLIAIFQRGAVDGLNMVVPFGESAYYSSRPSIAIPKPDSANAEAAINLDGFFGLHPRLAPLKPLWDAKQLAIPQLLPRCPPPHEALVAREARDERDQRHPAQKLHGGDALYAGWLRAVARAGGWAAPA